MAQLDDDDDEKPAKAKNSKLIPILLIVIILMLGVGGTLFFTGIIGGDGNTASKVEDAEEMVEETEEGQGAAAGSAPIYFSFDQPFTVNFETEGGLRFLQVGMELMSREQGAIDTVTAHLPVIQNNIIMLLSSQSYGDLISREGKAALQVDALKEIQSVVTENHMGDGIEAVYFTSFVIQ